MMNCYYLDKKSDIFVKITNYNKYDIIENN